VGRLGIGLLIIMGHTKCEAITAALDSGEKSVPVKNIINNIEPAIKKVKKEYKDLNADSIASKAVVENVWQTIDDIFRQSAIIRSFVKTNRLKVVGALYDAETGKVHLLGVHLRQDALIRDYDRKKRSTGRTIKK